MKHLKIKSNKEGLNKYNNKKWYQFIEIFLKNAKENDISATSAQISYYLVLSIFPFIIFFLNILSKTPIMQDEFLDGFLLILPDQAQAVVKGFISEIVISSSDTLLSLSVILTIWASSRGIYAIIKGINKAYGIEKPFATIKFKLLSLIFTVSLTFLIILVLATLVFGEIIGNRIFNYFNATEVFIKLWNQLRIIIPLIAMIIIFALIYKFSISGNKNIKLSILDVMPGAIFTTVGWIIYSIVFSYYINNFGNYSATYGSLGGIIILLLWLYMSSMLIVIGGEINASYRLYKIQKLSKEN